MNVLGLSDLSFLPSIVRRADIPEDLSTVQTVDARAETPPHDVGLDADAADRIWASALRWYRSGIHPAMSICIRVRGQVILRRSIGWSHGGGPDDPAHAPKVKVTPETPFNVFSASKPMAAMVIHLLDQRHQLHLDDPVCEYIPEFAQHGKQGVTIRHVLTHRAGIPVLPDEVLDLSFFEDIANAEAVRLLSEARPMSRAGGRLAYHALTGGFLIGEIVRRITGKNIRTVVEEDLCRPLGWRWMNYGVKRRDVDKVALSYFTGLPLVQPLASLTRGVLGMDFVEAVELSNDPRYLMGVLPAANLIATADELCDFYQLLLEGGTLRGTEVFDERTVRRATSETSYGEFDFTLGVPLRYGMGFMLGGDYLSLYGYGSRHAFGHLGLTNVVAWADPERHLSAAIMTSGKPVLYPEMHRALGLVYTIASACPKDETVAARIGEGIKSRAPRAARVAAEPASKPKRTRAGARRRTGTTPQVAAKAKAAGKPKPASRAKAKATAKAKTAATPKTVAKAKASARTSAKASAKPGSKPRVAAAKATAPAKPRAAALRTTVARKNDASATKKGNVAKKRPAAAARSRRAGN